MLAINSHLITTATSLPQHKYTIIRRWRREHEEYKVPLHTLLAASAEVLPLQLPMLVVMVMVLLLMMFMMVKVRIVGCGWTSVDLVFRWAFVDDVWVVTTGGAVVVLGGQMLWQRGDQILLLRHTDQTWLKNTHTENGQWVKSTGFSQKPSR